MLRLLLNSKAGRAAAARKAVGLIANPVTARAGAMYWAAAAPWRRRISKWEDHDGRTHPPCGTQKGAFSRWSRHLSQAPATPNARVPPQVVGCLPSQIQGARPGEGLPIVDDQQIVGEHGAAEHGHCGQQRAFAGLAFPDHTPRSAGNHDAAGVKRRPTQPVTVHCRDGRQIRMR